MNCRICNADACVHSDIQDTEEEIAEVDPKVDGRPARVAKIREDINNQIVGLVSPEEKARLAIKIEAAIGYGIAIELVGIAKADQFLVEEITARCREASLPRPNDGQLETIVQEIRKFSGWAAS